MVWSDGSRRRIDAKVGSCKICEGLDAKEIDLRDTLIVDARWLEAGIVVLSIKGA